MGKRRKTAKTGDKALYGSRERLQNIANKQNHEASEDEETRNERDQDFIRLGDEDRNSDDDEDKDLVGNKHSVLDLGAGISSNEDDDEDESSDEDDMYHSIRNRKSENNPPSDSDTDDDDDYNEDMIQEDPRNWGKKKSLYYHGDTADLEIGQEEDDAFLEEEAAKQIQASRFEDMDEDDFALSDKDEQDTNSSSKKNDFNDTARTTKGSLTTPSNIIAREELLAIRDVTKLSRKETRKLLDKQYPELLPMVSYFSDVVRDLKDRTQVATKVLMEGEGTAESVGATVKGQQYLLTKAMIQKSIALNSVMYLLLRYASVGEKDATSSIQAHPVMDQLKKFDSLLEKLEDNMHVKVGDIDLQLDNLVKAAALMDDSGDGILSSDEDESETAMETNIEKAEKKESGNDEEEASESSNDDNDKSRRIAIAQKKQNGLERSLNEARFGLRPEEAKHSLNISRNRRTHHLDDFGDLEEEDETMASGNMLASTINAIEQRSHTASRKRRPAPVPEELDELDEHDDQLAQGIKMMEEELGKLDDDNDSENDSVNVNMSDPDASDELISFYNKMEAKSKEKKSFKKSLYKVAPKFPKVDGEVVGERAISRTILKNRGLVAHKAKINRNPRVKKREQYRKALIRRKGAVREVRDQEAHKYGGEATGIKSGISRSRKLT